MMIAGLSVRDDGVICWNGIALEIRNVVWEGHAVARAAACIDPKLGPTWQVDHAVGALAEKISALGAIDQTLERMWARSARCSGEGSGEEGAGPPRPDR